MTSPAEMTISAISLGPTSYPQVLDRDTSGQKLISDSTVLRISNALQASLYVKDVIHAFATESRRVVRRITLRYRNRTDDLAYQEGRLQLHRASYDLNLLGKSLGELTFTRSTPFAGNEQALIEVMLCALIYPLRNALLYERALKTSLKDPLTGVNNRASLEQHLENQTLLAIRHGTPLSLLMVDLDLFKAINDAHGHVAGDAVLTAVAQTIIKCTRNSDIVFRYGGEEFTVILSSTQERGARLLAERIRAAIQALVVNATGVPLQVTASIGVAELRPAESSVDLFERTDKMLYRAKFRGRNQVVTPDD